MKRFLAAHVSALALLLIVGAGARASMIPPDQIQWTYNFEPSGPAVLATGNSSAGVTFTNEPTKAAVGSSDIVATNLRVFSTALANAPDMISGAYSLKLTLSALDSNNMPVSGSLTFAGNLGGSFSKESANVTNAFGSSGVQTLTLGTFKFDVQLIAYTPPGPPDQSNAGSISAHVTVSNISSVGGVPEPSTILLSGLGLSFLGGVAWRKRRQARA